MPSRQLSKVPGTSSTMPEATMSSYPSAKDCIMPYSMPLWTIFTKWPAPTAPACTKPPPSSGVRESKTGRRRSTFSAPPPTMIP